MTKRKKNILFVVAGLCMIGSVLSVGSFRVLAEDTGQIKITQNFAYTTSKSFIYQRGSYEIKLIGADGNYLQGSFPCTGCETDAIASGDVIRLGNEESAVISNIPAGTEYEIKRINIGTLVDPNNTFVYTGAVKAGLTEEINHTDTQAEKNQNVFMEIKTIIKGGPEPARKEIAYKLSPQKSPPEGLGEIAENLFKSTGSGYLVFDPIEVSNGFSDYKIDIIPQIDPEESGYTFSTDTWTAVISSQWGESRNVSIRYEKNGEPYEGIPEFTVNYLQPITYTPRIEKTLKGELPVEETFKFKISEVKGNPEGAKLSENTETEIKNGGSAAFDAITFFKAGVFYFDIKEEPGGLAGIIYDKDKYRLTVSVTETPEGLALEDSLSLNGEPVQSKEAVFENEYSSGNLVITKQLEGTDTDRAFSFKVNLSDAQGKPLEQSYPATGGTVNLVKDGDIINLSRGESLTISKLPEGAQFHVSEVELPPGFTSNFDKDSGVIQKDTTVTVNCTNKYQPESVSFVPKISKDIIGDSPATASKFQFLLTTSDQNQSGFESFDNLKTEISGKGDAEFPPIVFTSAGTYEFSITEVEQDLPGYTFDNSVWDLTVVIEDQDASLQVKQVSYSTKTSEDQSNSEAAKFFNTYHLEKAEAALEISKQLQGTPPEGYNTFKFKLTEDGKNPETFVMPQNTELTLNLNESTSSTFDPIQFSAAGEYHFLISEINEEKPGISYDKNPVKCIVTVTEENARLSAQVSYQKQQEQQEAKANFINSYEGAELSLTKTVLDSVTDKTFNFKILFKDKNGDSIPGTFTFESLNGQTGSITSGDTLTLSQDETITIENLPVGALYEITEIDLPKGYSPDSETYTGTIEKDRDNTLECINSYNPEPVTVNAVVNKEISGQKPPEDSEFSFLLEPDEDNPEADPVEEALEASITGEGKAEFEPMTFTRSGVYKYYLSEVSQEITGYSFDDSRFLCTVTVTDSDAILSADMSYQKEGEEQTIDEPVFKNSYLPQETTFTPEVKKTVSGEIPDGSEFLFNLTQEDEQEGAVLPENKSLTIQGSGKGTFEEIHFIKPGEYQFIIAEENQKLPGFTYDESKWALNVTVEDQNGILKVTNSAYEKTDETEEADESSKANLESEKDEEDTLEKVTFKVPQAKADNTKEVKSLALKNPDSSVIIQSEEGNLPEKEETEQLNFIDQLKDNSKKILNTFLGTNSYAEFENIYSSGALRIKKQVDGSDSNNPEFTFALSLTDENNLPLPGSYPYEGAQNGEIKSGDKFKLKKDEAVTINNIPAGTHYRISEEETEGYSSLSSGAEGVIEADTVSEVLFTNTKNLVPTPEGDPPQPVNTAEVKNDSPVQDTAAQVQASSMNPNTYSTGKGSIPQTGDNSQKSTYALIVFILLASLLTIYLYENHLKKKALMEGQVSDSPEEEDSHDEENL